ncbi:unnamed protein product [Auanema sp. JU1783]|nr:unnamed protein product [Auanema sp. JU1783]
MNSLEAAEDDDSFDENPEPIFKRGYTRTGGSFARLSAAIRRSIRLPSRSRQSQESFVAKKESHKKESGPPFSSNSNLAVAASGIPSRLDEIKENLRINRVDKVKKIVRKADWPPRHEVRRELWKELCKGKDFDSSRSVFRGQLEELLRGGKKTSKPQFLSEDGVVINNFDLNEQGSIRLLRLLKIIESMRPEISSAPILYPICAIMLHYLEDADVFACIHQLLAHKGYLMTSPVEWVASAHTILALIKKHKPQSYVLLKRRCGTSDDSVLVQTMRDWLSWIFQGLPLSHVVRIIDCFLVEGHKFITRAGIAIVYIWSKSFKHDTTDLSGKSQGERVELVKREIASTAQQLQLSTETFIETCVRIRNLQSSKISAFQKDFEDKLRDQVNHQQSLKKASRVGRATRDLVVRAFESKIVNSEVAAILITNLPLRLQLITPHLLFRLSDDGASFTNLWHRVDEADQSLIIIRTLNGEVFGAYCSSSWAERNDRRERTKSKYFGTGESFVWRLESEDEPVIYGWVGNNNDHADSCPQMFMAANDKMLVIGSGDGDAIRIVDELTQGITSGSQTFGSPALVEERTFFIDQLEVFGVSTGS